MTNTIEHKPGDWLLIGCYDNNSGDFTCQHCPKTGIRYEHELRHKYLCECRAHQSEHGHPMELGCQRFRPWLIRVGCVCAEKLTGDGVRPREHERLLKSRLRQKKTFLLYWKLSGKGNPFRKWTYDNHTYTVVLNRPNGKWAYSYTRDASQDWVRSKVLHLNEEEAKSAAFEELFPPFVKHPTSPSA